MENGISVFYGCDTRVLNQITARNLMTYVLVGVQVEITEQSVKILYTYYIIFFNFLLIGAEDRVRHPINSC